ncbi:MAG: hypothetical protein M1834_004341 [Cirrosporium novae-zelandiae]|nr:MAG: hypothetical protein M1834_004341 [Cirrosporium novae-zelandiae]
MSSNNQTPSLGRVFATARAWSNEAVEIIAHGVPTNVPSKLLCMSSPILREDMIFAFMAATSHPDGKVRAPYPYIEFPIFRMLRTWLLVHPDQVMEAQVNDLRNIRGHDYARRRLTRLVTCWIIGEEYKILQFRNHIIRLLYLVLERHPPTITIRVRYINDVIFLAGQFSTPCKLILYFTARASLWNTRVRMELDKWKKLHSDHVAILNVFSSHTYTAEDFLVPIPPEGTSEVLSRLTLKDQTDYGHLIVGDPWW